MASATPVAVDQLCHLTEMLIKATKTMNIAALNGMYTYYYKQAEDFVNMLEDNMRKDASEEKLSGSLDVAYISCDLLRFHIERYFERLLPASTVYSDGSAEAITLYSVKQLMAEANKIIMRQREVEAKLKGRGINVSRLISPRSQHRPLL